MIPHQVSIQAIRGFQAKKHIPLSCTLTVIYGDNGRGKTSLCEGWNWLFTGQMLEDLEPVSELRSAGHNIHVDLEPSVCLLDENEEVLIERKGDDFRNPACLPLRTSPVLLQYKLQQILYASQADRREFFERVMEIELESRFSSVLRRACLSIIPFKNKIWDAWERATIAIQGQGFTVPHTSPSKSDEQEENETALIEFLSEYFGCESSVTGIENALETGSGGDDLSFEIVSLPVSELLKMEIEEAISTIDNINAEAELALNRANWRNDGLSIVKLPRCPFCEKETVDERMLINIQQNVQHEKQLHSIHINAKIKQENAINAVLPLTKLNIDSTRKNLLKFQKHIQKVKIEDKIELLSKLDQLDNALEVLSNFHLDTMDLKNPDVFKKYVSSVLSITELWLYLSPYLETFKEMLQNQQARLGYVKAAISIIDYFKIDRNSFYSELNAKHVFDEIADVTVSAIEHIKTIKIKQLGDKIVFFYNILRPAIPTAYSGTFWTELLWLL